MLSLRNNLSFGFGSPFQPVKSVETLSGKHNAGYAAEDCVVAFLRSWALLHLPSGEDCCWQACCTSGLTTDKLEYRQGKNKAIQIGISHHG